MRLAIAAGILSQVLPGGSGAQRGERRKTMQSLLNAKAGSANKITLLEGNEGIHGKPQRGGFFGQSKTESMKLANPIDEVECDPNSSDADVGILSCGVGRYCLESNDHELGGVCMDSHRELQSITDICNDTDPYFGMYYECDCSYFDPLTYSGVLSCISDLYCDDTNTTCRFLSYTAYLYGGNYTSVGCYNFVLPYYQQVCTAFSSLAPPGYCAITFNGELCNSCYENTFEYDISNYTISIPCLDFDCSNTCGMHAGSECAGDYLVLILDPNVTAPECLETPESSTILPTTEDPTTEDPTTEEPTEDADSSPPSIGPGMTPMPVEATTPVATPAPTPPPVADPTPAPTDAPTEGDTPEPTDAGSSLITAKTAVSLIGLTMSLLAYFAA